VTNALGYFAGQAGELRESLVAGAVTEIELPVGPGNEAALQLRAPSGKKKPLPAGVAKTSIGPLDEIGVWTMEKVPEPTAAKSDEVPPPLVEIACNLASKSESDLRVPEPWQARAAEPVLSGSWFVRPIWFYLITCAWILAIGEWFLYQRRWIS
jgi:hypothetical protein